jgi:hypothetical protein
MAGVAFAVGFRVHTSAAGFLTGLGLVALFGYALSWGFVSLGLRVSDPEAAQAAWRAGDVPADVRVRRVRRYRRMYR